MRFSKDNQSQCVVKCTEPRNNQNINIQWGESIWKARRPRIHGTMVHRSLDEEERCTVIDSLKWIKAHCDSELHVYLFPCPNMGRPPVPALPPATCLDEEMIPSVWLSWFWDLTKWSQQEFRIIFCCVLLQTISQIGMWFIPICISFPPFIQLL